MNEQEQKKRKDAKQEKERPLVAEDAVVLAEDAAELGEDALTAECASEEATAEQLSDAELLEQAQSLAKRLAEEKEQILQRYMRLQADFDNFRRRCNQERTNLVNMANSVLIQSLLPVLDNFERAVLVLCESSEREGVQLIQRQLLEALAAAGLTPIEAVGADFDPQLHEAVLQSEAQPDQKGKVLGEIQKGYMLNDKLLRPSMVHVGG